MPAERLESKSPNCLHRQLDTQKLNVENARLPLAVVAHSENSDQR